jgi:hypothetical protein
MAAYETTSYTPAELFAGNASKIREVVTVKSGQNLAANTVVMFDADGKVLLHSGVITPTLAQSGTTPFAATLTPAVKLAGVLVAAVDASGGDKQGLIYCDGNFFDDKLVWPTNIDGSAATALTKKKLFAGSGLQVTVSATGEL